MVRRLIAVGPPLAAVLPGAMVGVVTWAVIVLAMAGSNPWRADPVNMSEAAALRDRATVVQLISRGEDPYARHDVRAHILFDKRMELTPLEAGIAAGRSEIVEVILFSARARPDAAAWIYLRCLSQLEGNHAINEILDRYRPESAVLECSGVTRPWK